MQDVLKNQSFFLNKTKYKSQHEKFVLVTEKHFTNYVKYIAILFIYLFNYFNFEKENSRKYSLIHYIKKIFVLIYRKKKQVILFDNNNNKKK